MMKKRIALLILTGACLLGTFPSFASQSVKVSMYGSKGTQYTILPDAETNRCSGINFKYTKSDNRTSKTVTLSAEPASDQSLIDLDAASSSIKQQI